MCLKCTMVKFGSERVTTWEHPARARAPQRACSAFVARVPMCPPGAPSTPPDCAGKKETSSCSVRHPPHARVIHERRLESQLDEETPERRDPVRGCAAPSRGGGDQDRDVHREEQACGGARPAGPCAAAAGGGRIRSEERRVGKESRSRWSP